MRGRYRALLCLSVFTAFGVGIATEKFYLSQPAQTANEGDNILYWVAPMDPNFRKDGPGKSPMGMDLVPVYEGQEPSGDPSEVQLSAAEINAIGVRTAIAQMQPIAQQINTVGFVGYNDHLVSHIHSRVEGWIENLAVRAVGEPVEQGQLLYTLYAPEITIASAELIRAAKRNDPIELRNAITKLRNFGMSMRQIQKMQHEDQPSQLLDVYAPRSGVITSLAGADGMFLKPETRVMSIADLSEVWFLADVFERDMARLEDNMTASARFDALPNHRFDGVIDYIYPELDPTTRTLRVRLKFENSKGLLRPSMFGSISLTPQASRTALTVPTEAIIRTARAERVMIRTATGSFKPRLVTTGLTDSFGAGGRTEILQGLEAGAEVVASAQFLIDSESALNAGLMRMAPTEQQPAQTTGTITAFDPEARQVTLSHPAIEQLDWPALKTDFPFAASVPLGRLEVGAEVKVTLIRGVDGQLAITEMKLDDGVEATGTGIISQFAGEGKVTIQHDPIPSLNWPSMTMDLAISLSPEQLDKLPIDRPISFDLGKDEAGLYQIIAVRPASEPNEMAEMEAMDTMADMSDMTSMSMQPIQAEGVILQIDAESRMATIDHGPMEAIGMPGMKMDFALAEDLDISTLPLDKQLQLKFDMSGGGLTLIETEVMP